MTQPLPSSFLTRRRLLTTMSLATALTVTGTAVRAEDPAPTAPSYTPEQQKAIETLRAAGAQVLPLAQNDPRLDVALHLSDKPMGDEQLKLLAGLPPVANLNLRGTKVTDAGLSRLAPLKDVVRLHLEKTEIGDAGLAHVGRLETLEYLNLYGTKITDAGLKSLTGLKNLKRLYVWETAVTDAGAADLKKALPNVQIIRGVATPSAG